VLADRPCNPCAHSCPQALLERKRAGRGVGDKGKFSEADVAAMENVE
jgi:hypothetical protein